MRIAVQSNGINVTSAYGIQARQLLQRLQADGHDVASFGWSGQGAIMSIGGIPQYPGGRLGYNHDMLIGHVHHHQTQLLITLHDLMVVDPDTVRALRSVGCEVWHWFPVDCSPLSVMDAAILRAGGGRPVAMSAFGLRQLELAGFTSANAYVPHSIDTTVFRQAGDAERAAARDALGIPPTCFVVAVNAANKESIRKGWWEAYSGFAAFHGKHPDSLLMIHSESGDSPLMAGEGIPFDHAAAAQLLGIADAVRGIGPEEDWIWRTGVMDERMMAGWYNLADVYLCASWAEGFGIPLIEAMACGVPVIGTDCSAVTELVRGGGGWLVPSESKLNPMHKREWRAPWIKGIEQMLTRAHLIWRGKPGHHLDRAVRLNWQQRQERAREFAAGYDVDLVYERGWRPLIKHAEEQAI